MSSTHEIITIQCGHYANFVGTHWWNIQESSFCYSENPGKPLEINHDVMFREGLNPQGEVTFTPRLISIDTKSSLKSLSKEGGTLYVSPNNDAPNLWHESPVVVQEEPCEKNAFLKALDSGGKLNLDTQNNPISLINLDNEVTVWSDYLKTNLHPRSLCLIEEYSANGDENVMNAYGSGIEAFKDKTFQDSIEEKIRLYVEECDYLQGFQFLVDGNNGFCAISNCILQHLDEEYNKITKAVYPVFQKGKKNIPVNEELKVNLHQLFSVTLGFNGLNTLSSYFSPLSLFSDIASTTTDHQQFFYLQYKPELSYHTSAILAAALETSTSPYRLKKRKFSLSDIADNLVIYGRKMLSLGACLPFVMEKDMHFDSKCSSMDSYMIKSLTPYFKPEAHCALAQSAVLRGISNKLFSRMYPKSSLSLETEKEYFFGQYLRKYSPSSLMFASLLEEKCPLFEPFPKMFMHKYSQKMELCGADTSSAAIAATLSNSNNACDFLQHILSETKTHMKKIKYFAGSEFEGDEFSEVIHNLVILKENYGPEYSM